MASGQVVAVTQHTAGSELEQAPYGGALFPSTSLWPSAALWPGGPSQLDVVDPIDFGDSGTVQLVATDGTTETAAYEVPEDQDVVDLATSLSGTYEVGNMVYVLAEGGWRIVERWADILEPQGVETLRVRVPHTLYDRLALGIREQGAGEMVTFTEEGTDHVITDVLGKSPDIDISSASYTTSPGGTGQRVEIDEDGIRLIDSDGDVLANLPTDENETPTFAGYLASQGVEIPQDPIGVFPAPIINALRWLDGVDLRGEIVNSREGTSGHAGFIFASTADDAEASYVQLRARKETLALGQASVVAIFDDDGTARVQVDALTGYKTLLDSDGTSEWLFDNAWANWTPTLTGWSANPTDTSYRYVQIGKTVHLEIAQGTAGTSNAATKTISLPVTAASGANRRWTAPAQVVDNGTTLTTSGLALITAGGTVVSFGKDWSATGNFTASGNHRIASCVLTYEVD